MARILIIDDSQLTCAILSRIVRSRGHEAVSASTLREGLRAVAEGNFDVVLLDVLLPDGNGLEILPRISLAESSPEVIIMTAEGDADGAALAISNGAWDYLEKGASADNVSLSLSRALQYRARKTAGRQLELAHREGLVGSHPRLKECLEQLGRAAASDASVLVSGETGTGKELAARAIHANSSRAEAGFVIVDCAALPESLVESILFGHKKGAFTGADRDAEGLVRLADSGTLFLDEIGELPLGLQKSFLRVLEDKRFRPVGGKEEVASDFRLVAATNRDLDAMVSRGEFRSDLLFRIRSFHVVLPPLRERVSDIREIATHHVKRLCERYGLEEKSFSPDFFEVLEAFDWPGNVRELVQSLERAVVKARQEPHLFPKHLPSHIRARHAQAPMLRPGRPRVPDRARGGLGPDDLTGSPGPHYPRWRDYRESILSGAGKRYFRELLDHCGGDARAASRLAGLSLPRFYALLKEFEIAKRFDVLPGDPAAPKGLLEADGPQPALPDRAEDRAEDQADDQAGQAGRTDDITA